MKPLFRRIARTAAQPLRSRPTVTRLAAVGDGTRLTLSEVPKSGSALRLVGRTSTMHVDVGLADVGEGLQATVTTDHVALFGTETVDLYVAQPTGSARPRRVVAGVDVAPHNRPGAPRRWYATIEGNLSIRRQSAVEAITHAGVFDEPYYRAQVPDLPADVDAIEHYVAQGAVAGVSPSTMFDSGYYQRMNPDVRRNPLAHYCEYGWSDLRDPSPDFDTWWYLTNHMPPGTSTNPLAHYEETGKAQRLSTRPPSAPSHRISQGHRFSPDAPVRRICLFAAWDPDGIVDDYVVAYVTELARFSDVYYLADCAMAPDELAKLAGCTLGAWAEAHGEYDFGSYSRLAARVGWDTIEQYDELLLVNDSGYLLRPLDDVFARMEARACDWWGLQATKGLYSTRRAPINQFREPIPMEQVRTSMIDGFEEDYTYDFLVGSFFLAYRTPVIRDETFRHYLASVVRHETKRQVVKMYEVGLTRWLILRGHSFDTFVPALYPMHPVYSNWYFRLLDDGFPLLKRFLLSANIYQVPRLAQWEQRVLEKVPDADVETIRRNLARVVEPEVLRHNLHIGSATGVQDDPVPEELLSPAEFAQADRVSPKHASWWAFPVCGFSERFSGNERAVFEEVKDDPTIRKIVLTRSKEVRVGGVNVEVVPLESPQGQHALMRCGTIFIKHTRHRNVIYPVASELHNLIQLWHGIPFKRIGYASADYQGQLARVTAEQSQYRAVISSSQIDTLAMTAAFYPLTFHQVWNTGLPRNDFVLRAEENLPAELREQIAALRRQVAGRRLVLLMPTFRNTESGYRFTPDELTWLRDWLDRHDAVLGVREHMADAGHRYRTQLADLDVLDLSDDEFPHVEVLYRVSDALITDYSSAFVDFMLTGRPMVSFAYDYESYQLERGGFYDLDLVFPGPICRDFGELQKALDGLLDGSVDESYEFRRRLFFDHLDDRSSARVVTRVRDLTEAHGVGKPRDERSA